MKSTPISSFSMGPSSTVDTLLIKVLDLLLLLLWLMQFTLIPAPIKLNSQTKSCMMDDLNVTL